MKKDFSKYLKYLYNDDISNCDEKFIRKDNDIYQKHNLNDNKYLIHELQIHQIELETQNEELKRANLETDSGAIELSTYQGSEFWHTYPNFSVIKKYNNSNKYAMAVHQLAQGIKQRYLQVNALKNN